VALDALVSDSTRVMCSGRGPRRRGPHSPGPSLPASPPSRRARGEEIQKLYDAGVRDSNRGTLVRARRLRNSSTLAEEALWERLRDRKVDGLKFRRQVPVGPYVADFFCHELRLVLELDGPIHEAETQASHDLNRDANLRALGYRVLRITNREIENDLESVLARIVDLYHRRSISPLARRAGGEAGREGSGE
jgi:very-short-patch-repair endonuclease